MGISTSTGTLTAGQSRTFNLSPASAVTLTLSPNVRVTITETPESIAGSGVGGNATRVHEPRLPGTFTYGPYPMGGEVVVENESNSGSSVGWTKTNSIPFLPTPNSCVLFGDSITEYNTSTVSNATANQARGYMVWANLLLGRRRLNVVSNLGVGGDTTEDMLARVDAACAVDAGWAVVLGGVNDLAGNLESATTVTANLEAIYDRLRGSGKRVIAISVLPVTAAHSLFSLGLMARIHQVNRWIRAYCAATPGMVFVDGCTAVTDPASTNSAPATGYYDDVTHIGMLGAYYVGKAVADAVRDLIAPIDEGPASVGDSYFAAQKTLTSLTGDGVTATATLAAHDLLAGDDITVEGATPSGYNGSFVVLSAPTTGTFTYASTGSGAATGTIKVSNNDQLIVNPLFGTPSAGLASGWTKTETNTTSTPTTAARADGLGNWQQLAITASAAGDVYLQGGDVFSPLATGDVLVFEAEVEVDAAPTNLSGVQLNLNMIIGGVTYTPTAMNRLSGSSMPSAAWAGLIRTEPFTVPDGAITRCRPQLRAFFSDAGGATVRFGRSALRKVR